MRTNLPWAASLSTFLTTILTRRAIDMSKPDWKDPLVNFHDEEDAKRCMEELPDTRKTQSSFLRVAQLETQFRHLLAEIPGAVLIDPKDGKRTKLGEKHQLLLEYVLRNMDTADHARLPSQKEMAKALREPEKSVGRWWREVQAYINSHPNADQLKSKLIPVGRKL
ncbi:MAG: hypothetical protein Q8Q28_02355 [Pseudomonadota bacterium]|nr:hypothetical protein [Pseudomonadota bacterium]